MTQAASMMNCSIYMGLILSFPSNPALWSILPSNPRRHSNMMFACGFFIVFGLCSIPNDHIAKQSAVPFYSHYPEVMTQTFFWTSLHFVPVSYQTHHWCYLFCPHQKWQARYHVINYHCFCACMILYQYISTHKGSLPPVWLEVSHTYSVTVYHLSTISLCIVCQ